LPDAAQPSSRSSRSSRSGAALRRALCLLVVAAAAKLALLLLRASDGGAAGLLTPWAPPVLLYQEAWAVLAVLAIDRALLALGTWLKRPVLADRLGWAVYAAAAGYVALNVPIARQFATPLTYAFLEAAGGALRDSITAYATAGNVLAFVGLLVLAVLAPRMIVGPPTTRVMRRVGLLALLLVLVLGPIGAGRVDTLGLHRGALVTLVRTTWARWGPVTAAPGVTATALPAEGAALDLTHLAGSARGFNVVWVILESTGARHLRSFGAELDATPRLTALAARGLLFERMYTSYPESIKSLLPLLCGEVPAPHTSARAYVAGRSPCTPLAARLGAEGYRTGLFHSGRFVYLGMAGMVEGRGFEVLADAATIGGPYAVSFGTDDRSTAARVLEFVDAGPAERPFFALYMPIAGHHPYRTPGTGRRPFAAATEEEHHRNDLHVGDEALGELIDGIAARGLMDRTVWLIMGDHGEAFHEHPGNFAHSLFVWEENVHIPVVVVVARRVAAATARAAGRRHHRPRADPARAARAGGDAGAGPLAAARGAGGGPLLHGSQQFVAGSAAGSLEVHRRAGGRARAALRPRGGSGGDDRCRGARAGAGDAMSTAPRGVGGRAVAARERWGGRSGAALSDHQSFWPMRSSVPMKGGRPARAGGARTTTVEPKLKWPSSAPRAK
jgi:hypothetical protein